MRQFLQTFGSLAAQNVEALACADADQLTASGNGHSLDNDTGGSTAIPKWQRQYFAKIAGNLVIRLISNDLKEQFVAQMMALALQPEIDKRAVPRIVELRESVPENDNRAAAIILFFDACRICC